MFISLICSEPHHRLSITELKFHPYLKETRTMTRSQTNQVKGELNEIFSQLRQQQEIVKQQKQAVMEQEVKAFIEG